ncbi:Stealth CR1 domain-containing protein [Jannaschia sp. Os4]|uniref:Stealth CR1 domain-containing protein n=1 Tax=Jannaschia sp. Os4 TaxID=2807617 RepID=UPI00193A8062|nr:Stealth CR1 domain-containing protein [Jannaschia sp. Os4]MBM2576140.1 Stealth CR1 domain-containing protein [Jannaschia sp. Os4]
MTIRYPTPATSPDGGPIDAVIAWVDGDDPAHAAKRAAVEDRASHSEADRPTRWAASHEIYWCIASILMHAPYVRTIWVVTDEQTPAHLAAFAEAGLVAPGRLRVVDHAEVFAGVPAALPTFNSLTIEAVLHRIPGLAERFVYFNDDFFLCRDIPAAAWFDAEGRPVLHGRWEPPEDRRAKVQIRRWLRRLTFRPPNMRPSYRVAHWEGARLAGVTGDYILQEHHPHPMRRSTLEAFHAGRPEVLARQASYRFRHRDQYLPVSLANHLEVARFGAPRAEDVEVAYLKASDRKFGGAPDVDAFEAAVMGGKVPFGCLQSLDEADPATRARLIRIMTERFAPALPPVLSRSEETIR